MIKQEKVKEMEELLYEKFRQAEYEAIKEFAEKIKETIFEYLGVKNLKEADNLSLFQSTLTYDVVIDRIDELLKEYEEEE